MSNMVGSRVAQSPSQSLSTCRMASSGLMATACLNSWPPESYEAGRSEHVRLLLWITPGAPKSAPARGSRSTAAGAPDLGETLLAEPWQSWSGSSNGSWSGSSRWNCAPLAFSRLGPALGSTPLLSSSWLASWRIHS
eukprot:3825707-Pyramimonas_sp.AAC.1